MKATSEALLGFQGSLPPFYLILIKLEEEISRTEEYQRKDSLQRFLKNIIDTIEIIEKKLVLIDDTIQYLGSDNLRNLNNEDTNVRLISNFWNDLKSFFDDNFKVEHIDQIIKNDIRRYCFF